MANTRLHMERNSSRAGLNNSIDPGSEARLTFHWFDFNCISNIKARLAVIAFPLRQIDALRSCFLMSCGRTDPVLLFSHTRLRNTNRFYAFCYLFLLSFNFVTSNQITGEFIARLWSGFCILCAAQRRCGTLCNRRFYNHWRSTNEHFSVAGSRVAFVVILITDIMHHLSWGRGNRRRKLCLEMFSPSFVVDLHREDPSLLGLQHLRHRRAEGTFY